jgi:hypothetical protein
MLAAAIALLLLAPEGTHEIKLRFEKGMVYEDAATRRVKLTLTQHGKSIRFDREDDYHVRRTVLEVGTGGLPEMERVEVLKFASKTNEWPDQEPGVKENPAQGKSFVWRKKKDGGEWALYADDKDVTEEHPRLVERLLNWRAARVPGKPVAIGATWEVPAQAFLEATGQQVPPGLEGSAVYKLEEVEDGIARISFEFKSLLREQGRDLAGIQRGTWLLDVAKGRELSLESEGSMEIDGGKQGFGTFEMKRTITYR